MDRQYFQIHKLSLLFWNCDQHFPFGTDLLLLQRKQHRILIKLMHRYLLLNVILKRLNSCWQLFRSFMQHVKEQICLHLYHQNLLKALYLDSQYCLFSVYDIYQFTSCGDLIVLLEIMSSSSLLSSVVLNVKKTSYSNYFMSMQYYNIVIADFQLISIFLCLSVTYPWY